jgi:hypothetical protein
MREGAITAEFSSAETTQEQIMTFATNPVVSSEVRL